MRDLRYETRTAPGPSGHEARRTSGRPLTSYPDGVPALEDKDLAPTWLVFTPREQSPQYRQYETPSERVRHDPETLVLDVPGRPLPFRWTDEVSLWGVGAGAFAGIGTAMSVGAAEAFLAGLGIGVVIDVCRTVWRVARELHERQPQVQLGTTTMSFTDEGFRTLWKLFTHFLKGGL